METALAGEGLSIVILACTTYHEFIAPLLLVGGCAVDSRCFWRYPDGPALECTGSADQKVTWNMVSDFHTVTWTAPNTGTGTPRPAAPHDAATPTYL